MATAMCRAPITHGANKVSEELMLRVVQQWRSGNTKVFQMLDSNNIPILYQIASAGLLPYDVPVEILSSWYANGRETYHVASSIVGLPIRDTDSKFFKNMTEDVWCQIPDKLGLSAAHFGAIFNCLPKSITLKMWNLPMKTKDKKTVRDMFMKYNLGAPIPTIGELINE